MSNAIEGDEKFIHHHQKWENEQMPETKDIIEEFHFHL